MNKENITPENTRLLRDFLLGMNKEDLVSKYNIKSNTMYEKLKNIRLLLFVDFDNLFDLISYETIDDYVSNRENNQIDLQENIKRTKNIILEYRNYFESNYMDRLLPYLLSDILKTQNVDKFNLIPLEVLNNAYNDCLEHFNNAFRSRLDMLLFIKPLNRQTILDYDESIKLPLSVDDLLNGKVEGRIKIKEVLEGNGSV